MRGEISKVRVAVVLGAGLLGASIGWWQRRSPEEATPAGVGPAAVPLARHGRAEADRPTWLPVRAAAPPSPSSPAPTKLLGRIKLGGLRTTSAHDWTDTVRDEAWAPEMERAARSCVEARLAVDHPDARVLEVRCMSRTCQITLDAPVEQAELVRNYLSLTFSVDDLMMRPGDGTSDLEGRAGLRLGLLFEVARLSGEQLLTAQALGEQRYPERLIRYRAYLARLRSEGVTQ